MGEPVCEHGVSPEDFCEPCSHVRVEEWVGYPMLICARCVVPWPCEYVRANGVSAPGVLR